MENELMTEQDLYDLIENPDNIHHTSNDERREDPHNNHPNYLFFSDSFDDS